MGSGFVQHGVFIVVVVVPCFVSRFYLLIVGSVARALSLRTLALGWEGTSVCTLKNEHKLYSPTSEYMSRQFPLLNNEHELARNSFTVYRICTSKRKTVQ